MKKSTIFFAVLSICLCGSSCISFSIIPSFPLEGYVESMVLCSAVEESGELLKPSGIKKDFSSEEKSVLCFIELKNISRKIQMRWRWYGPDKTLSRDSGDVLVNREEQYLEVLTAYDELMIAVREEEETIGRWTVVVLIDKHLVGRREFEIKKGDSPLF